MESYTADEVREALKPIASLISKSEKAQGKLAPQTWQHAMLEANLDALHIANALMGGEPGTVEGVSRERLEGALRALDSMIGRTEAAGAKFSVGTSHHTLQRNRLSALHVARTLVSARLEAT